MHQILNYQDAPHRSQVVALWEAVFAYKTAHSSPELTIAKKLAAKDGLFFVATADGDVAGTVLAGYDGHRGWLYSLAVDPLRRHLGLGGLLVRHAERALAEIGCLKVNLQIMSTNESVVAFYESLGYAIEPRISMGKLLVDKVVVRV
jgi:ribosomal protein S18 acetylase RimI-like enzyme